MAEKKKMSFLNIGDSTFEVADEQAREDIFQLQGDVGQLDQNKADMDDVETALAGKANTTHSHAISDVTGLQTALAGIKLTKIWENPNPNSAYTATASTDKISLNNANEIIIEFSFSVVSNNESNLRGTLHLRFSPNYISYGQVMYEYISRIQIGASVQYVKFLGRLVRFTGDNNKIVAVSFGDCHVYDPSTSSVTTSNDLLVPQAIYKVGDIYQETT